MFVARAMTPAIVFRDCLVKLLLLLRLWGRIPTRSLILAVVTACWLGAGWSVGTLDMSRLYCSTGQRNLWNHLFGVASLSMPGRFPREPPTTLQS